MYRPFKQLSSSPEEVCRELRDRAHGKSPQKTGAERLRSLGDLDATSLQEELLCKYGCQSTDPLSKPQATAPVHTRELTGSRLERHQPQLRPDFAPTQKVPACPSSLSCLWAKLPLPSPQSCSAHPERLHKPRLTWKCLQPFIYIIPGSRNWKGKLCSPAVRTPMGNKRNRSVGQAVAMEWCHLRGSEATRQGPPHYLCSCLQPTGQLQIQ